MSDLPYFTAIGAWGDIFACYSQICLMMKEWLPKANILYYGFDRHIKEFLEYQDNIEKVLHIKPDSWKTYEDVVEKANKGGLDWIDELEGWAHLNHNLMVLGNLNSDIINRKEITHRTFNYKVPSSQIDVPIHSVLFNPYSFQSCSMRAHWPFIPNVLQFLVDETDWHVVLAGQEKTFNISGEYWDFPLIVDHPRVTNLVGKTKSMFEVLAVAEDCEAIISTSNCLALWSIVTNKPAIILMNSKLTEPIVPGHEYWKKWIETEPNQLVYYDQNFDNFLEVYQEWNND
jgi:hypothetical protein